MSTNGIAIHESLKDTPGTLAEGGGQFEARTFRTPPPNTVARGAIIADLAAEFAG